MLFRASFVFWVLVSIHLLVGVPGRLARSWVSIVGESTAGGRVLGAIAEPASWPGSAWYWLWMGPGPVRPGDASAPDGWPGLVPWLAGRWPVAPLIRDLPGAAGDPRPQWASGSGDQLYNWLEAGAFLALAVTVTIVWTTLDRRRAHPRLAALLRILLRGALIVTMLSYGFGKVFPLQFPEPSVSRLLQPYGESSPMGLVWTFMGASTAYQIFGGAAEVLGALLLMTRRTTLAGALVVMVVMTNVFLLNMCYDVPVKLYSGLYLAAAWWLIGPDLPRLVRLLLLNRAVEPAPARASRSAWVRWPWRVSKWGVLASLVLMNVVDHSRMYHSVRAAASVQGLDGTYAVDSFTRDGVEAPPLVTDSRRWKRIALNTTYGSAGIRGLSDVNQRFTLTHDPAAATFTFHAAPGRSLGPAGETDERVAPDSFTLRYTAPGPDALVLDGQVDGTTVRVTLHRLRPGGSLLLNRGFHWISPTPFNR